MLTVQDLTIPFDKKDENAIYIKLSIKNAWVNKNKKRFFENNLIFLNHLISFLDKLG